MMDVASAAASTVADCPQCSSTAELVRVTGRPWTCAGCGDELAPAEALRRPCHRARLS
jgi:ribosomal protein L37AE/L43A